jgi:hypothetical protein
MPISNERGETLCYCLIIICCSLFLAILGSFCIDKNILNERAAPPATFGPKSDPFLYKYNPLLGLGPSTIHGSMCTDGWMIDNNLQQGCQTSKMSFLCYILVWINYIPHIFPLSSFIIIVTKIYVALNHFEIVSKFSLTTLQLLSLHLFSTITIITLFSVAAMLPLKVLLSLCSPTLTLLHFHL